MTVIGHPKIRAARIAAAAAIVIVSLAAGIDRAEPSPAGGGQPGRQNTWSARSSTGQVLAGTWTVTLDSKTGAASGSWTLLGPDGRMAMRGGWSAIKAPGRWSGSWRANVVGSAAEFSGTWNASLDLSPDAQFSELFARAIQGVVSGTWRAGSNSGSWSIRAFSR